MDFFAPPAAVAEFAAPYLQLAVTVALISLCWALHLRYRKAYFGIWALAWTVYALRILAIVTFVQTGERIWLFWHQVTTGWTALALLWAAVVFSQNLRWMPVYLGWVALPVVWAYVAIYLLDSFLWAATPMVAFLSVTTAWTAWAFHRYDRLVGSPAARFLVFVLAFWALHHLDYPFLRARGIWNPWGYYLDILFAVSMGLGILFLVLEDLDQGLRTLTALSSELQRDPRHGESTTEAVLRRALALRGVHGSALFLREADGSGSVVGSGRFVHGAGVAALWPFERPPSGAVEGALRVCRTGMPVAANDPGAGGASASWSHAYTAALPILRDEDVVGALVVVGEARDPFTVLDNRFLLAFGQQVGASLANERLHRSLAERTEELERLQSRMVHQHEEERNRLWRELHDETAQVLAALNMQLGMLEERGGETFGPTLQRAKTLLAEGIRSIRSVTRNLRPMALDDLGLLPSLRALVRDFQEHDHFVVRFRAPEEDLPPLSADTEVALYRTLQEALANSVRHSGASTVDACLVAIPEGVRLVVEDDGTGFSGDAIQRLRSRGGLAGIRERILALGGEFVMENSGSGGARVRVTVPATKGAETDD